MSNYAKKFSLNKATVAIHCATELLLLIRYLLSLLCYTYSVFYLQGLNHGQITGRTWLVRASFDVENLREDFRLFSALPTVRFILDRGGRVILLSHRGRPKEPTRSLSLNIILPFLTRHLGIRPVFFSDFDFANIRHILRASSHRLFLLENLRFSPGEEANDPTFAKNLASLGDGYVNDDFAASHRVHASIATMPKFLSSYCGLQLAAEIKALGGLLQKPQRPFVVLLGGAKVPEKLAFATAMLKFADSVLVGGVLANTLLAASGKDIKASTLDSNSLPLAKKIVAHPKLHLPIDFIWEEEKIRDIGPQTIPAFSEILSKAKTIIWNGAMGLFEDLRFAEGSIELAHLITGTESYSVVGGGETTALVQSLHLASRFDFVSTGGGAMLDFLSGRKLPGIEILNQSR